MILLVSVLTTVKIIVFVNNLISLSIPIEWVIIINLTTLERSNTMFNNTNITNYLLWVIENSDLLISNNSLCMEKACLAHDHEITKIKDSNEYIGPEDLEGMNENV